MSFWASSQGLQLESFTAAYALCSKLSCAGYFYDDCKEPARVPRLVFVSIESF